MNNNIASLAVLLCAACLALNGCRRSAEDPAVPPAVQEPEEETAATEDEIPQALTAVFHTSMGKITCELYPEEAPLTVDNFVFLARGSKKWTDPKTGEDVSCPLYDGTVFHRVIPDFMIQGGDPMGTGMGGPGYEFEDEISGKHRFDAPGILAMANAGPDTNGSQFFITVAPTPWLNGRHTIFGRVVSGQDIVEAISMVDRDSGDKPLKPVVLNKVEIIESFEGTD